MPAKETISYTDKELEAIKVLEANRGAHLTAKELGLSTAILTSLAKKSIDARPMDEGFTRVMLNKEDVVRVVKVEKPGKAYWID